MKNRKKYENADLSVFDYFLTFISIFVAVSALWMGIWVFMTGTVSLADESLNLIFRAFTGEFAGEHAYLVSAIGILFYVGAICSILFIFFALFGKHFRAIVGALSMILNIAILVFQLPFIVTFIFEVSGIFVVGLSFLILCEFVILVYTFKLLLVNTVPVIRRNPQYVFDMQQEEKESEKPVKEEVKEEQKEEAEEQSPAEELSQDDKGKSFDIKVLTFDEKLRKASKETKARFKDIRAYFESLGFKASRTKFGETFVYKNVKYAQITTMGKNGLKIYYKLNFKDYENTTIPVEDLSSKKKYERLPVLFRVKSDLSVKRAKKLMDDVMASIKD